MKYMGSKRAMLLNGLGEVLRLESKSTDRFVDLFCGSGAVAWFASAELRKTVLAVDLQCYSSVLAASIVERTETMSLDDVYAPWAAKVEERRRRLRLWSLASNINEIRQIKKRVTEAREVCTRAPRHLLLTRSYGGHYFAPAQSLTIDTMLACLPSEVRERSVLLACIIIAASKCVASPGHTAQPFQPTPSAGRHLHLAWVRDPMAYARQAFVAIASRCASSRGTAVVDDAVDVARHLNAGDLAFVDPPYSGVHYSRFYHVLETIARGKCGAVTGTGRYPPPEERPFSAFSRKSESLSAATALLDALADTKCSVVFTFPNHFCSNGLSAEAILGLAKKRFAVKVKVVASRMSTLGGNVRGRAARQHLDEVIMVMRPGRRPTGTRA